MHRQTHREAECLADRSRTQTHAQADPNAVMLTAADRRARTLSPLSRAFGHVRLARVPPRGRPWGRGRGRVDSWQQSCECSKGRRRRTLARCVICLSLYGNRTTGRQKETNRERYSFRCHNFPFILNIAAYCHPQQFKPH